MPKSKRHPARRPQQRNARRPHPQPAAAGRPAAQRPAAASSRRRGFEVRSAPLLATIHRLPRWIMPLALAAVLVLGLILPSPLAGLLLLLVAAFLGWLLALSWPLVDGRGRVVRLAVVAGLVVVAVLRLAGRF